jgi:hypothetical protein
MHGERRGDVVMNKIIQIDDSIVSSSEEEEQGRVINTGLQRC